MNKPRKNSTGSNLSNNGTTSFDEQMEQTRMQVVELEYKARYWKAQYEIRHYTLLGEGLQKEYDKYIEAQKVKNEELRAKMIEQIEKTRLEMVEKGEIPDNIKPIEGQETEL